MSERKSWDVQPKARARTAPVRASEPKRAVPVIRTEAPRVPKRVASPEPQIQQLRTPARRAPLPSGTLRERRSKRRRIYRYVFLCLLLAALAGSFYVIWRPTFRIQTVSAQGPGSEAVQQIALSRMQGTYLYLIPRNSTFFYPQAQIRSAVLDAVPEVAAVSLKRDSFSSLALSTIPRDRSFTWCGTSIDTPNPDGVCYDADVLGYLFKQSDTAVPVAASSTASSTTAGKAVREQIRVFGALDTELKDGQSPIRAHVASASQMADALKFVDAVRTLGAPVSSLAIRGDEADLWLSGPTRVTYVLGQEKEAADTAASAFPSLNLTNGTIQYVDLRFPGKVYSKKFGE